jgi:hypothetical protein
MPLRKFKTDTEVQAKLGITKEKLADLRNGEGMPHIPLAKGQNVYFTDSLIKWLLSREENVPEDLETD